MRKTLALLCLAAAVPGFAADRYEFDENHQNVRFTFNHFGFSNISASFETVEGHLMIDPGDFSKSSVEVTIPIGSVHSGVAKFDEHLKSADFFDTGKYPNATFRSTKVEPGSDTKLKVTGDLTMHGVTKPVVLDVTVNKLGPHPMAKTEWAGFDAHTTINRSEFGLGLYSPNVSEQVDVNISVEAKRVDAK
ncbi:MAG TPA: YceI family protein [Candidatus Saccharimonadia bacterium]|nr:YceI family protein [Candidatus Saccharimonadia bacterium]